MVKKKKSWKEENGIKETVKADLKKRIGFPINKAKRQSDKNWVLKVLQL